MPGPVVRTERSNGTRIAVVRRRAAQDQIPGVVQEACGVVWNAIKASGVKGGRQVAVYLGSSNGQVDMEIGAEVGDGFRHGEVIVSTIPPGEVVTATHFGQYSKMEAAHSAIRDWCAANHRTLAGPSWEIYGHWEKDWNTNPAKIRTDVYYLLKS